MLVVRELVFIFVLLFIVLILGGVGMYGWRVYLLCLIGKVMSVLVGVGLSLLGLVKGGY